MSLYFKNKRKNEKSEKNQLSKWAKHSGKIYSILGVVCVVIVVMCLVLGIPKWTQAAEGTTPTGWSDYPMAEGITDKNLGDWKFNRSSGSVSKLSDLVFMGTQDGKPCAAIQNEDQLNAVLNGLKTSYQQKDVSGNTITYERSQSVIFKLMKDMTVSQRRHVVQKDDGSFDSSDNFRLPGVEPFVGAYIFKKDIFDGLGNTITVDYSAVTSTKFYEEQGEEGSGYYFGHLFGRVEDSTIQNLNIEVASAGVFTYDLDGIPNKEVTEDYTFTIGAGIVCGIADNAQFLDIEIKDTSDSGFGLKCQHEPDFSSEEFRRLICTGSGGIVGCMQSNVLIRRCSVDLRIQGQNSLQNDFGGGLSVYGGSAGGIAGLVTGSGNQIIACYFKNEIWTKTETYGNHLAQDAGDILGGIIGIEGNIEIADCLYTYYSPIGNIIGRGEVPSGFADSVVKNCYGDVFSDGVMSDPIRVYNEKIEDPENTKKLYWEEGNDPKWTKADKKQKKERINDTDWEYDAETGEHYLLHPDTKISDTYDVDFGEIIIGDPTGDDFSIEVNADVINWFKDGNGNVNSGTSNAKAYLSVTTGGEDPIANFRSLDDQVGHEGGVGNTDLRLSAQVNYSDTNNNLTVKAAVKVVFTTVEGAECYIWSPVYERNFAPEDLYIARPDLQVSIDEEEFEEFKESVTHPLGTTKLKLIPNGQKSHQLYYYFGERSGLVLGDEDSEEKGTITLQTLKSSTNYKEPFTLVKDMKKNTLSNKVYMYVLAYIMENDTEYYKLYEYDLNVFAKDDLVMVSPENGSKIPNGATITFKVGNGEINEFPYDKMRVLVKKEKQQQKFSTLDGQSGVEIYGDKIGDGTKDNPYYLTSKIPLEGEVGETFYIYIEPIVNESSAPDGALPYKGRYGSFVQEYSYTIMEKATGLELSPVTITTSQAGNPTSIPINEKVYMNSSGSSDIIVYNIEGEFITPQIVSDDSTLNTLNSARYTQVGKNAYYLSEGSGQESVLYVRNNNVWYAMENADSLYIYQDGKVSFDVTYAGKTVLISTILFSYDYDYSENLIYKYIIQEQNAVDAPIALLASGSSITMNKVLIFHCGQNCVMYYTVDGKEPQITVDSTTGIITPEAGTYLYSTSDGIVVTEENGYNYGESVTVKMMACPVQDVSAAEMVYNNDLKSSEVVTFNYNIVQQNQVEAPVAYPETTEDAVAEIVNGDRISLSCATSGAEIYYTVDGSTPVVKEENRYSNTIEVKGDYGGYFSVKAIAHKEGMKDSEVVTFLYKIADKETAGSVTAIPGTTNKVIAGDKINLSVTVSGAEIYYTTDGTTPEVVENSDGTYTLGESVLKYNPKEAITVPEGTGYFVIHAIAVKAGMKNSEVAQFIYTYADVVGAPYGNPSAGTVVENTQVTLKCAQKDAVIYYEIAYNGAKAPEPTTSSSVFSEQAPIVITRDTEIKAFAYYDGQASEIVTLQYVLAEKMKAPEPSISSGAIVPSGTTVSLPVKGGSVYYTTDGSDPADNSNAAVNIGTDVVITGKAGDMVVIKACTKESGATTSELVTFTYQISQYPGGVTTDTENGTTVAAGTVVNLTTDVTGGTIYYTTGSGDPVSAGSVGNSVTLSGKPGANVSVKAVAVAPNTKMNGSYAFFDYKLMEQLAAPSASIKDGTSLTEKSSVVLKANQGKIYYTIDGRTPTRADYEYTAPIVVAKDMTIKAIAIEEGYENSEVSSFSYAFSEQIGLIKPSVPAGTVESGAVIKLDCNTPDAKIYYTTDGTEPVPGAEGVFLYEEDGISVYRSVNIKAVAVKDGMCNSELISLNYRVDEVPIVIEKEKVAAEEEEAGLKPSDVTKLEARRANEDTKSDGQSVIIEDVFSDTLISGKNTVISDDAKLRAKEISVPDEAKKEIKNLLGSQYEVISNYDFTLYENGNKIQPKGEVEIGIPIPEGYENADVMIVYINENNGVTVYNTRREGNYAYAKVSHFSSYAIAGAQLDDSSSKELDLILILSVVAGAFVLVGIGMIIRTAVKRKRYE